MVFSSRERWVGVDCSRREGEHGGVFCTRVRYDVVAPLPFSLSLFLQHVRAAGFCCVENMRRFFLVYRDRLIYFLVILMHIVSRSLRRRRRSDRVMKVACYDWTGDVVVCRVAGIVAVVVVGKHEILPSSRLSPPFKTVYESIVVQYVTKKEVLYKRWYLYQRSPVCSCTHTWPTDQADRPICRGCCLSRLFVRWTSLRCARCIVLPS